MNLKSKAAIFAILLLVCNLVLLYIISKERAESSRSMAAMYPYVQRYVLLKSSVEHNIKYSSSRIKDTLIADGVMISDLFSDSCKAVLILRVAERYCNSCVKYSIGLMNNENLSSKIRTLFFTGFQNVNRLSIDQQGLNLQGKECYNIQTIDSPIDYAGFPYLMVLNRNLEIEYCYFPSKGNEQIDLENINMIIDCYAKKYGTVE